MKSILKLEHEQLRQIRERMPTERQFTEAKAAAHRIGKAKRTTGLKVMQGAIRLYGFNQLTFIYLDEAAAAARFARTKKETREALVRVMEAAASEEKPKSFKLYQPETEAEIVARALKFAEESAE